MASHGCKTFCLLTFILVYIQGKHVLVPTYFARKYKNGSYIDATIKSNWFQIKLRPSSKLLKLGQNSNASLTVGPIPVKNAKFVKVTWKGVQNPNAKDFIALYCPETSKENYYLDLFNVDESKTYNHGYGEYSVQLYNIRTNCEMRYFRYVSKDHQEFVTKSYTITFEGGPEMPLQIHLALTGDPTQMRVMWVSGTGKFIDSEQSKAL